MTNALGAVLLDDALHAARTLGASDLHLAPFVPPMLRIDGVLQPRTGPGLSADDLAHLERRFLNDDERCRLTESGDVTSTMADGDATIRVHASRLTAGTTFALRFLAGRIPSPQAIGIPAIIGTLALRPSGLVVIGGPTGSGKSTTLASLVDALRREQAKKIITIEDPIEYRMESGRSLVVQREVGSDVETFEQAIRGALRSDPDVIVIGEMRDHATVAAAIVAAETGHLVLATLHTADAVQTVDRLIDALGGERSQGVRGRIAQVLLAATSQRLMRRFGGAGRVMATEVLVSTDSVRHMIRDGKQHQLPNVIATGRRFGMQSLESHVAELSCAGAVAPQVADSLYP